MDLLQQVKMILDGQRLADVKRFVKQYPSPGSYVVKKTALTLRDLPFTLANLQQDLARRTRPNLPFNEGNWLTGQERRQLDYLPPTAPFKVKQSIQKLVSPEMSASAQTRPYQLLPESDLSYEERLKILKSMPGDFTPAALKYLASIPVKVGERYLPARPGKGQPLGRAYENYIALQPEVVGTKVHFHEYLHKSPGIIPRKLQEAFLKLNPKERKRILKIYPPEKVAEEAFAKGLYPDLFYRHIFEKQKGKSKKTFEEFYEEIIKPILQNLKPTQTLADLQTFGQQVLKNQYRSENISAAVDPFRYAKMASGQFLYDPETRRPFPSSPYHDISEINKLPIGSPERREKSIQLATSLSYIVSSGIRDISGGMNKADARQILKVKKNATQGEIRQATQNLLNKEFPERIKSLASRYKINEANLIWRAANTLHTAKTTAISIKPPLTPPYKGQLGELEKRLDYLIGFQPTGAHWKQEYRMRNLHLEEAKQGAPAKVIQEIEKIQGKLDDLRFAKQEFEEIGKETAKVKPPATKKEAFQRMQHLLTYGEELVSRGYSRKQLKFISSSEGKKIIEQNIKPEAHWTFVKEVKKYTRSKKAPSGPTNPIIKRDLEDFEKVLDVKKKVNLIDYLRTPEDVLVKIGLGPESKAIRQGYENYRSQLKEEIEKISQWAKRAPGKDANRRIFRYLDGQISTLSKTETKVAEEIESYLKDWAKKLDLPEDHRIKYYITHLFEKGLIKKEFDPELAKIIDEKVPGEVYDPFLQKRLGKWGYKEDTWAALDAYVKRGCRKVNMDPALKQLKKAAEMLDVDSYKYIQRYASRINLRPTEIDNLLDNLIKSTPIGYRLTQRPTAYLTQKFRQTIYRGALGLNIGSAMKNLTQGTNTFAKLGTKYTALGYLDLAKKMISQDFDELHRTGILQDTFIQDRNLHAIKRVTYRIDQGLWLFFDTAEKINRGSAYFGAKKQALNKGLSESEAVEFGKKIVRETQFAFSAIDNPVGLSSDLIKTFTQFQSYSLRQGEFLARMLKNREFGGLLRYIAASLVLILSIGRLFGMRLKDMIPSFRLDSPLTQVGATITGLLSTDEEKRREALRELPKAGALLFPAGTQIKKTIEGLGAYGRGYSQTPAGRVRFPVEQKQSNLIRGGLFGQWNLPEAQEYFKEKRQPLGEKQSELFKQAQDKLKTYREIIAKREENALIEKAKELVRQSGQSTYYNDHFLYLDDDGAVRNIDTAWQPSKPELTGNEELDKKLISKYRGELTQKANDIVILYEKGVIDEDEAEERLTEILKKREAIKSLAARKAKKISIRKITKARAGKTIKSKKGKIVGVKIKAPPKIKIKKPKTPTYIVRSVKPLPELKYPKAKISFRKPTSFPLGATA